MLEKLTQKKWAVVSRDRKWIVKGTNYQNTEIRLVNEKSPKRVRFWNGPKMAEPFKKSWFLDGIRRKGFQAGFFEVIEVEVSIKEVPNF